MSRPVVTPATSPCIGRLLLDPTAPRARGSSRCCVVRNCRHARSGPAWKHTAMIVASERSNGFEREERFVRQWAGHCHDRTKLLILTQIKRTLHCPCAARHKKGPHVLNELRNFALSEAKGAVVPSKSQIAFPKRKGERADIVAAHHELSPVPGVKVRRDRPNVRLQSKSIGTTWR